MRRVDRERSAEYATLSMVDVDGNPYCVPITVANDGEYVYFHSATEGTKVDALSRNPKVCLACVGYVQAERYPWTRSLARLTPLAATVRAKAGYVYDRGTPSKRSP